MTRIFVYEAASGGALADDGGGLLDAGLAMRDAIVGDLLGLRGVAVTCAVSPALGAAPPAAAGRSAALACAREGEDAPAFVQRMAGLHDLCWIVAPETQGLLLRLQAAVSAARWIGCTAAAIRVASSKLATAAALERHGIATARSAGARASRWVVKPDDGAGALDTRVHADAATALADLRQRRRAGFNAAMEPWVEGEALSIALAAGGTADPVVALNRQCIEVDAAGQVHDRGVLPAALDAHRDVRAPHLRALARAVVAALPGLRGFVGIDLVWHAVLGPVVMEVNPRVTCAYVGLSQRLDHNLAADILSLHAAGRVLDAAAA